LGEGLGLGSYASHTNPERRPRPDSGLEEKHGEWRKERDPRTAHQPLWEWK
jgi:hypothetical protein